MSKKNRHNKHQFKVFKKKISGYHVYRSDNPNLPFSGWKRLTERPIPKPTFRDRYEEDDDTLYYYKFTKVDMLGREGKPYAPDGFVWLDKDGKEMEDDVTKVAFGHHVYRSTDRDLPLDEWERLTDEPAKGDDFTTDAERGVTYYYYYTTVNFRGEEGKPSEIMKGNDDGTLG